MCGHTTWLAPRAGIEPKPLQWKLWFLTTRLPRNSLFFFWNNFNHDFFVSFLFHWKRNNACGFLFTEAQSRLSLISRQVSFIKKQTFLIAPLHPSRNFLYIYMHTDICMSLFMRTHAVLCVLFWLDFRWQTDPSWHI